MRAQRVLLWLILLVAITSFAGVAAIRHFMQSNAREQTTLSEVIKATE